MLKNLVCAAVAALCFVVPVSEGRAAGLYPGTHANLSVVGAWTFQSPQGGPSTIGLAGSFAGAVTHFDPFTVTPYRLTTQVALFDEAPGLLLPPLEIEVETPPISLAGVWERLLDLYDTLGPSDRALADGILDVILDNSVPSIDLGDAQFSFSYSGISMTSSTISGDFTSAFATDLALADMAEGLLPRSAGGGFQLTSQLVPLPLPAGLPMLGAALLGFALLARRRASARGAARVAA